jgi:hypothetical protein
VARRLIFPRPQFTLACPRPAWPQGAVYQGDRALGGFHGFLSGRPELRSCLLSQWRQQGDVPRDRGLVDIKDLRPDFLDDVIASVPAGDDKRLAQGKSPWAAVSLIPRFCEQIRDHLLEFIELR